MDDHLDGSHLGDTGHIGWLDGSWKREREKQKEKAGISQGFLRLPWTRGHD